jgi:hypothetical protein
MFMSHTRGPSYTSSWPTVTDTEPCNGAVTGYTETKAWGNGSTALAVDTSSGFCDPESSPLVVDLDRTGVIEIESKPTNFDIDGNGSQEFLAQWIEGTGDAFLYDSTLDGLMSGLKLFGDQGETFENGFEKLAVRDVNSDGVIDGEELVGIALWVDNGNAHFNVKESAALTEAGIVSISLSYDTDLKSLVTLAGGESLLLHDVYFSWRG